MAESVMTFPLKNLYQSHLRPSFTNLEAAEIMLVLKQKAHAHKLLEHLHTYTSARVASQRLENRTPSNLDDYLSHRSQELLLGLDSYDSTH